MGFFDWLHSIFAGGATADGTQTQGRQPTGESQGARSGPQPQPAARIDMPDLARRLGMNLDDILDVPIEYEAFTIPKRRGGLRRILAPRPQLKALQRKVLRRVLGRLRCHPAAMGFERGRSIVTHARGHAGAAVLLRMDIRDFFPSTWAGRVTKYFQDIGWSPEAAELLTRICTHEGHLPQGAPTSPRLSNLLNFLLDARLSAVAGKIGAVYSRYADDITFSFDEDKRDNIASAIRVTKLTCEDFGYVLHLKQKLSIRRQHQRQSVTGLVVNDGGVRLPRETRRRLRAARHHLRTGRPATLTPDQLAGWAALEKMIELQGNSELA